MIEMDGHEGHRTAKSPANDIHNGCFVCWDCGMIGVYPKYPVEYITLDLDLDMEDE
jgi:hypothetical protein